MPVAELSGPRCSASAATSFANSCFSFTTLSRPSFSPWCWRVSFVLVICSDATKIGLWHRPNARYPAPLWPRSTMKDHNRGRRSQRPRTSALPRKADIERHDWYVRFVPILLQKSLMVLANSDSVALIRFAAESGDDGAAQSQP